MLQGLPRIRHKVSSVSLHCFGKHLHSRHALQGSFYLRDTSTKHHFWVRLQHHVLHLLRGSFSVPK
jgi:hypothetical protein